MNRTAAIVVALTLGAVVAPSRTAALRVNDRAPELELSSAVSTETVSLASLAGKVVFVHFWASWCTPCKEELPKLNALAAAYAPEDFALLAITVDSSKAKVAKFLNKNIPGPLKVHVLHDPDGKTARAFQNRAMPMTYVVDRDGMIRFVHMGFVDGDEEKWRAEIAALRGKKAGP